MAETPSAMLELGTEAPSFSLPNVTSGDPVSLSDFDRHRALLVMFICRHCPYVQHVKQGLARLGRDYASQSLGTVAVSANDPEQYPDDRPERLAEFAKEAGFNFPVIFDESQDVAKAYRAACTPDFYVFNQDRELVYRGQLDDSRPGNEEPVTGEDLRDAIDRVLAGHPPRDEHRPSTGCSIKWKPGNEPDYVEST